MSGAPARRGVTPPKRWSRGKVKVHLLGVSLRTIYAWRAKYGGLFVSEVARLRQLEDETSKIKQMVAEPSLDTLMLQEVLRKEG